MLIAGSDRLSVISCAAESSTVFKQMSRSTLLQSQISTVTRNHRSKGTIFHQMS